MAAELMASGIECFRVLFPYGADANDVATAAAKPADALGRLVRAAEWMGTGKVARRQAAPAGQGDGELPGGDVGAGQGDVGSGEGDTVGVVGSDKGDSVEPESTVQGDADQSPSDLFLTS